MALYIDGKKVLSDIVMSGTWTASGTVTLPAITLGGDIDANSKNITNMGIIEGNAGWQIRVEVDNSNIDILGGAVTAGFGAKLSLFGKDGGIAGAFRFITPDAAKTADITRLTISGSVDTAVAAWAAVTHTGIVITDASFINTGVADDDYYTLGADDTGVGIVEVARVVGTASPHLQIGRDDTGVATDSVTGMLILQAGAGSNNEAANFGLGIVVKLGNASSEVEERGRVNWVLTDATNGAEKAEFHVWTFTGGAINQAFKVDDVGELYADLDGSGGSYLTNGVNLFDEYDDALELRRFMCSVPGISTVIPAITEELRLANRERLVELGVCEVNPNAHSGYMMKIQPMMRLLAGGIYQTAARVDALEHTVELRIHELEYEIKELKALAGRS